MNGHFFVDGLIWEEMLSEPHLQEQNRIRGKVIYNIGDLRLCFSYKDTSVMTLLTL